MAFKLIIFACALTAANAGVLAPYAAAPVAVAARLEEFDPRPQYSFGYDVQDSLTGDYKSQQEVRDGDVVQGSYSLVDPDGTKRTVDYAADSVNGFNAVVRKEPLVAAVESVAVAPAPIAARVVAAPAIAPARYAVAAEAPVIAAAPARYAALPARYAAAPVAYSAPLKYAAAYSAPVAYSAPLTYSAPVARYSAAAPVAYTATAPVAYTAAAPVAYTAAAPVARYTAAAPVAYTATGPVAYSAPLAKYAAPLTYPRYSAYTFA